MKGTTNLLMSTMYDTSGTEIMRRQADILALSLAKISTGSFNYMY